MRGGGIVPSHPISVLDFPGVIGTRDGLYTPEATPGLYVRVRGIPEPAKRSGSACHVGKDRLDPRILAQCAVEVFAKPTKSQRISQNQNSESLSIAPIGDLSVGRTGGVANPRTKGNNRNESCSDPPREELRLDPADSHLARRRNRFWHPALFGLSKLARRKAPNDNSLFL